MLFIGRMRDERNQIKKLKKNYLRYKQSQRLALGNGTKDQVK